jgi:hypothetical protein
MVIRDYAFKDFREGYQLEVLDLPPKEQDNLLNALSNLDQDFRLEMLAYAQKIIDSRIGIVESEDRYEEGFRPIQDCNTGELIWSKAGGF